MPFMAEAIDVPVACNQVLNIGTNQLFGVSRMAEAVARAMDVKPRVVHVQARNEVWLAYLSHDKIQHIFGQCELYIMKANLSHLAPRAKRHGAQNSCKFDNIEANKNFPKAWEDKKAMCKHTLLTYVKGYPNLRRSVL